MKTRIPLKLCKISGNQTPADLEESSKIIVYKNDTNIFRNERLLFFEKILNVKLYLEFSYVLWDTCIFLTAQVPESFKTYYILYVNTIKSCGYSIGALCILCTESIRGDTSDTYLTGKLTLTV